ncbi:MAG: 6-carboxytetrahydropterin synthase [Phycisphaerales bacterium]|nr:6-carboxytetrahydropterin synthase [Phycisphaerales bacterium]
MFAIEVTSSFRAYHALRMPGGERGGVEASHLHLFQVTVKLAAERLDAVETVIDFHIAERLLGEILSPLCDKDLNSLEPFHSKFNPTAERIAQHVGERFQAAIAELPGTAHLVEVRLTEAPQCVAIWTPD